MKADLDDVDAAVEGIEAFYGVDSMEARIARAYRDHEALGVTQSEMVQLKRAASGVDPNNLRVETGPQPPRGEIRTGRYTSDHPVSWGSHRFQSP